MNDPIEIGKLQRTNGLKGQIHLFIKPEYDVLLDELKFLMVQIGGQIVPFFIENIQDKAGRLIVKFEKVDSESDARKLVNAPVFTTAEFLAEPEGNEFSALAGYLLKDENYGELGTITEVQEYPQQFIFSVNCKGKEVLLPVREELITGIDDEARTVTYNAPEGLIELYLE